MFSEGPARSSDVSNAVWLKGNHHGNSVREDCPGGETSVLLDDGDVSPSTLNVQEEDRINFSYDSCLSESAVDGKR